MKILHLLQSNKFSGAENVVCQIVSMFKDEPDFEMVYCSPDGDIRQSLKERNVEFVPLKSFCIKEIKRAIKEQKPDIIHAHDISAGVFSAVAADKNIKIISHVHVNNSNMAKVNYKTLLYKIAAKRFSHIFWVSDSCFECYAFRKSLENKSSVLFNVVDKKPIVERAENAELKDNFDIAFIGRMQYQKNPQKLINVFKILKEKYNPEFSAAIVGVGPMSDEIRNLINSENLQENVKMLGFLSNPMGILKNAKLMILTSRFEGTPMCALEAMALGTPIVSTPTDGMTDLIKNGENGFLCESDEELAKAVHDIISDSDLRKSFSLKAEEKFNALMNLNEYKNQLLKAYKG